MVDLATPVEFKEFAKSWGFRHVMSSPHYPQSNGLIERAIQTVKTTMKKAKRSNIDPELALLYVRATQTDAKISSPANLLYNRNIKTNLPMRAHGDEETMSALCNKQETQKQYYDRTAKDRADLQVGQSVGLQNPQTLRWTTGTVTEKRSEPRSHIVQTADGTTLRRNHRFLNELNRTTPNEHDKESATDDNNTAVDTQQDTENVLEERNKPDQNRRTASGRIIKTPAWKKDYV